MSTLISINLTEWSA